MKPPIEFTKQELENHAFTFRVHSLSSLQDRFQNIADHVNARLAKLFEGAVEIYQCDNKTHWQIEPDSDRKIKAIMLKPEPIVRGVTKEEIVSLIRNKDYGWVKAADALADRIEKEGIL